MSLLAPISREILFRPNKRPFPQPERSFPSVKKPFAILSEGHAGCDFGKTWIAEVTGTPDTDTVANGRSRP